ncbi:MAG: MFS transporter [Oscillospiraceae bacterium]|nr:MFS transporter [Oscillospiraceae bacterium]
MKKVTNKVLWIFAVGQLGWSLLSGIVVNWLVYFYQPNAENIAAGQTLFIPQGKILFGLTVIGLIAAVGRLFDAVTDPWIASKSDRCTHKDGRRIPFMRWVAIPFGIVTVLMFVSPLQAESHINSLFLLIMSLLFYLCMTIYCTPYNALIPELGKTQKDRINLSTFISVTFFLGTAIAYLLPNIAAVFTPALGYVGALRATIGGMATFAVVCMLVPVFAIKEKDYADTKPSQTSAFKSLSKTFANKSFLTFVKSDILYWIALTIFQTGLPFYITSLMKLDAGMSFVLFAVMTGMSLVFYAPVNVLAKKLGKKKMVVSAFLFFSLVFFITAFSGKLGINGIANGLLISVLASIPMAVLGILPQAIVADIAESDAVQTHENREGMFYAARTFAFKLGQSAAMLIFTALAKIGTDGFGYRVSAVVAAVLCLIGGLVLLRYNEKKIFETLKP